MFLLERAFKICTGVLHGVVPGQIRMVRVHMSAPPEPESKQGYKATVNTMQTESFVPEAPQRRR